MRSTLVLAWLVGSFAPGVAAAMDQVDAGGELPRTGFERSGDATFDGGEAARGAAAGLAEPAAAATPPSLAATLPSLAAAPTSMNSPEARAPGEPIPSAAAVEVVVRGRSTAQNLRRSAQAVEVVDLRDHHPRSTDLGEVLARTTSLKVQRDGGLGSAARYSLAGLSGDRVRFLLDGLPLELSPFQLGVGNVPLALVERVEVHQGVVPIRFGADALGGAVNLVSDEKVRESHGALSYELGSFDTHRLAAHFVQSVADGRAFVRGVGFWDHAANDYPIDIDVADDSGQLSRQRVRRFHDGYRGYGGAVGAGLVGRPWADRLVLQAFAAAYHREVQSNPGMTVPYGEVAYERGVWGATAKYAHQLSQQWKLDASLGYALRDTRFRDVSRCRYDWYGRCFLTLPLAGEVDAIAHDTRVGEHSLIVRAQATWRPLDDHALRVAWSPSFTSRTGRDRQIPGDAYDVLRAERRLLSGVFGVEHEWQFGGLANLAFVKGYHQNARSEEKLPTGVVRQLRDDDLLFGGGDSARLLLGERVYLKASYEYATRLATAAERFGDGTLVVDNLRLDPERSHNYNFGVHLEDTATPVGAFHGRVSGLGRHITSLIVLVNAGSYYQYANVLSARALGFDASVGWAAPADWIGCDAAFAYQDVRNVSSTGPGALFAGDRIPNMPFMQTNVSAYLRARGLRQAGDAVQLTWNLRRVEAFRRGWESAGVDAAKLTIPSQTVHALALVYSAPQPAAMSTSFEVQNLTDAAVFDFYGVARPGRSFHWKLTIDYP